MSRKKMILKLLTVIVGTVIAAFELDIAIYAGFGSATLAVLWQGMAKTIRITIGQASLIIASAMVVFCWFYDRKQIHIGTILYQVLIQVDGAEAVNVNDGIVRAGGKGGRNHRKADGKCHEHSKEFLHRYQILSQLAVFWVFFRRVKKTASNAAPITRMLIVAVMNPLEPVKGSTNWLPSTAFR